MRWLIILVLTLPVTLALDISIGESTYQAGEEIQIEVTGCSQAVLVEVTNALGEVVYVDQGSGLSTVFTTDKAHSPGEYSIKATCFPLITSYN